MSVYCPVQQVKGLVALPARLSAYEVFGRQTLIDVTELPMDLSFGETKLYFLGTEEEVRRFAQMTDGY